MTTIVAPELKLIGRSTTAALTRRFVGGCVGHVYPTVRDAYTVGGSAGWVHPW